MAFKNSVINSSEDLITTHAQTRQGFLEFALHKNDLATPFVDQAKVLLQDLYTIQSPNDIMHLDGSRNALIAASGLSDKAIGNLNKTDLDDALKQLINRYLNPAGAKFREEAVYRFLLTRGDSLGGKMRNLVGHIAQGRLIQRISSVLTNMGITHYFYINNSKNWVTDSNFNQFENVKAMSWEYKQKDYVLGLNLNIKKIGKNIDINLFKGGKDDYSQALIQSDAVIMFGELKGGIDPAGADEHWKTGNSSLQRDRVAFNNNILTSFVGAAIAKSMADEIYNQLQSGVLSNAANLYKDNQLTSYAKWIIRGCK